MTIKEVIDILERRAERLSEKIEKHKKQAAVAATSMDSKAHRIRARDLENIVEEIDNLLALIATNDYHDRIAAPQKQLPQASRN